MEDNRHIKRAIRQARKEGNKDVEGFVGGLANHHRYNKLLNEGKLEVFEQRYKPWDGCEGYSICLLMRRPL